MSEIYSSIQHEASAQIKVEGSRFIADAFSIEDEESAKSKIEAVRKKYFDAAHHCFAYVIGADGKNFRYSDDGEPSGTAGIKIYNAIRSKNLSDILLAVTRYFGGTKLGVGGLGRAYFDSASTVLSQIRIIPKAIVREVEVTFPFSETNSVMNVVNSQKIKIARTNYSESNSILTLQILPSKIDSVETLLRNATKGIAQFRLGESKTVVMQ